MRTRNREVNIFNMSLLDILTGMLGAFLFLMLGLVPYYTKTSKAKPTPPAVPAAPAAPPGVSSIEALTLQVTGHWYSPTKVGIFLYGKNDDLNADSHDYTWRSYNTSNPILQRSGRVIAEGTSIGIGWQGASAGVLAKERYLVAFEVPPTGPAGPPKGYARLGFTIELLLTETTPGGKNGATRYAPTMFSFVKNASRAQPGTVYGAFWINTTEDPSKPWYAQYNYNVVWIDPSGRGLPRGVLPLPGIDDTAPPESEIQQAGIGVSVSSDAQANADQIVDHLLVKGVFAGGPAAKAGLQVGDKITQINGLSVAGKKFDNVVRDWLQGKAGSPVQISVTRAGEQSPLSFVIERAPLNAPASR